MQKCDRRVEIKSEKVLEANSYVFRSYKGKSSKEPFCPPSWIESKDIFVDFFRKKSPSMNDKICWLTDKGKIVKNEWGKILCSVFVKWGKLFFHTYLLTCLKKDTSVPLKVLNT